MEILWVVLLLLVLAVCWVLTVVGIPGNWLMIAFTAVYVYFGPADSRLGIGWPVIIALLLLATLGEIVEFLAGSLGATSTGGSKRGAALAVLGSVVGALVGAFVGVPVPVVGPLIGAVLFAGAGAFIGALLGEQWKGKQLDESVKVGLGAFVGRICGTVGKIAIGSVMFVVVAASLFL